MKKLFVLILAFGFGQVNANDVISVKRVTTDLATEIATEALKVCRANGYQVSVVIVDRGGNLQVALRDNLAARFTTQIAQRKANAVILSASSTKSFAQNRSDIKHELNELPEIMILEGGLPINAAGSLVGAIGISGAPGGEKDAACAKKALDKFNERLEFAD